MRVQDPAVFGHVAVLMGGTSAEREVSLDSGRNVLAALRARGVRADAVDGIPNLLRELQDGHFDRVFHVLHGNKGGGEDGVLQGLLEALGVPYTGSGVLGSALSMDKIRSKQVWLALGLPTPRYVRLSRGADVHAAARELGLPVIVKPACEGSSVGVSRVYGEADLDAAIALAAQYPGELLMEQLIEGGEYTIGVLGGQALASIHIVPKGAWYDYNAKYVAEDTQYICPGLDEAGEAQAREQAERAFAALDLRGWARIDFMRDRDGRNWLLEANTAPGMTSHSLMPKSAAAFGVSFEELCWRILEMTVAQGAGP
ncbi:D-alanine--D-alanine ligase [Luteimonas weifangensis]|uniref:D-alanine--D-alanine ligase n=1 Tax=Cognatiluteimonas weifangensis TaxID=2303539 RepID=A0A372DLX7_9GAMM|nr:D-alanine--D-alanine ligase [Luteimonas weifangensis]